MSRLQLSYCFLSLIVQISACKASSYAVTGADNTTVVPTKECCDLISTRFQKDWYINKKYLTTFLTTLKTWNCKQLEMECQEPSYNFTSFTSVLYKLFCNTNRFGRCCENTDATLADSAGVVKIQMQDWPIRPVL